MQQFSSKHIVAVLAFTAISFTTACEKAAPPAAKATAQSSGSTALPANLIVTEQPAGAVGVVEARTAGKIGERVAVIGRIGGSRAPFVSNRAIFTIVDQTMKSCAETGEEDHCPRPWDYCCEDKKELAKSMASIEISDANGKPLELSLESEGTLKPLMLIAVEGTLQSTDGGSFLVRAERIYKVANDPLASKIK
ncbi:MAG: hypothetical protein O2875_02740 [Planctomycetota bacterium]|nr:hypothetical protein [Planctomycetota bacterium]MDA1261617.1 hypothetical protein [Planctomycetota bacterium]